MSLLNQGDWGRAKIKPHRIEREDVGHFRVGFSRTGQYTPPLVDRNRTKIKLARKARLRMERLRRGA